MKIDLVIGSLTGGGAERVVVLIANYLSERGYDIKIIIFNEKVDYELSDSISLVTLTKGTIKNQSLNRLLNLVRYYKVKDNRPDLTFSFITRNNFIAILSSKLYGMPVVACEHNNYLYDQKPVIFSKLTKKYVYRFADKLTVLTKFDLPFYKKHGVKAQILPNPTTFNVPKDHNEHRENVILAIGVLDRIWEKGFDTLIELIAPILIKNDTWQLEFVGKGETGKKFLKNLAIEKGIEDRVSFLGFRKDVAALMMKSAIFILPSRNEGLPMVLLEAMSQGMACIAFDCRTGPSDIIEHEVDGILVEDQNKKDMQEELQQLIDDENLRIQLGRKAMVSIQNFSIENIGNQWMSLIEEVLAKKNN